MKINQRSNRFVFTLILILMKSYSALGAGQDQSLDSNSQARQIVAQSEKALGESSAITIIVNAEGHELWEGQGPNPGRYLIRA